jgi:TPR repeat protein
MYYYGLGISKDLSKSKYWVKKAHENPSANSKTKNLAEENWNELELWKY